MLIIEALHWRAYVTMEMSLSVSFNPLTSVYRAEVYDMVKQSLHISTIDVFYSIVLHLGAMLYIWSSKGDSIQKHIDWPRI